MDFFELDQEIIKSCRDFEQRWERDKVPPRIEEFLERSSLAEKDQLFEGLLASELELLATHGNIPRQEDYIDRFPDAKSIISQVFSEISEATLAPLPEQLGDFKIVWKRGHGATSIVYEAFQISLQRRVALKLLVGNPFRELGVKRLNNEARAIALLNHPHIVTLHGVGIDHGYAYLVMQYVDGCGLDRILENGASMPTPWLEEFQTMIQDLDYQQRQTLILEIVEKIASALSYAHQNGILHRDVKPSNILISGNGDVFLSDFGLACLGHGDSNWSAATTLVGTPHYMPPEVFDGEWTAGADIYALGTTLHQLLTLQKPEQGFAWRLGMHKRNLSLPRPRALNPRLDRDLEAIVIQATQLERSKRYQSADDLLHDLRAYKKREPITARRAHALRQFILWLRREPMVAGLSIALFLTLVVGIIQTRIQITRTSKANRELQSRSRQTYLNTWDKSLQTDADGTSLLWLTEAIRINRSLNRESESITPSDTLRFASTLNELPVLERMWFTDSSIQFQPNFVTGTPWVTTAGSSQEILLRDVTSGAIVSTPMTITSSVSTVSISPNRKYLAASTSTGRGDTTIFELPSGHQVYSDARPQTWVRHFSFSRDSKYLAIQNDKEARILNTSNWQDIGPAIQTRFKAPVVFSNDGTTIHQVNTSYSLSTNRWGKRISERRISSYDIRHWKMNSDQNLFALAMKDGLQIFNTGTKQLLPVSLNHRDWHLYERPASGSENVHSDSFLHIEISPNGEYAIAGSAAGVIISVNLNSGIKVATYFPQVGGITDLAFFPSGSAIATASEEGKVQLLSVPSLIPLTPPLSHESAVTGLDVSSDGTRIVTMTEAGITRVWNVIPPAMSGGKRLRDVAAIAIDPDLETVAIARTDGRIEFRSKDLTTTEELTLEAGGRVTQLLRSQDGKVVASLNEDSRPRVWRLPQEQPFFESTIADPFDIVLSPDGQWLARMHSVNFDLIHLPSGNELASAEVIRWKGTRHPSRKGFIFVPGSDWAYFTTFSRTLKAVNLKTGNISESKRFHGSEQPSAMAIHPNQNEATVAFDKLGVRFLSLPSLEHKEKAIDTVEVIALENSPDAKLLAIALSDGTIRITSAGEHNDSRFFHGKGLDGLIFVPRKTRRGNKSEHHLVSWDIYGRLRTWDLKSGNPNGPMIQLGSPIRSLERGTQKGTLLAVTEQNILETVHLPETVVNASFKTIEALARLYTGHKIVTDDNLAPLESNELAALWKQTRDFESKRIDASNSNLEQWRRKEITTAFASKQWNRVFFHSNMPLEGLEERSEILSLRAHAAARLGKWQDARRDYLQLSQTDPAAKIALTAASLALNGKADIAMSKSNVDSLPYSPDVKAILLAVLAVSDGREQKAWDYLKAAVNESKVLKLASFSDLKYRQRRASSQDRKAWETLQLVFTEALRIHSDSSPLTVGLGIVHLSLGNWAEARKVLESISHIEGENTDLTDLLLARSHFELDEWEAIRQSALSPILKQSAEYQMMLGRAHVEAQEWSMASKAFNQAIDLAGTNQKLRRNRHEAGRASLRWPIGYGGHNDETIKAIELAIESLAE